MENQDTIFSDLEDTPPEGTYLQRLVASAIDTAIAIGCIVLLIKVMPREMLDTFLGPGKIKTFIFIFLLIALYRLVCLLAFDKTVGMMITKLKYLNEKLQPLSIREKLVITLTIRTKKIRYYKFH
jgi:uncharacterized RDD family membrane protein YckC